MRRVLAIAILILAAVPGAAMEVGSAPFRFVADLSAEGFTPFATSSAANASFGMTDGRDLYLCFIADNLDAQAARQQVLIAEINGDSPDRTVPNIPVVCILTQ